MRFAGIERDDHALVLEIDLYVVHAFNFHEGPAQLSHSLMVIFAFGGDFDGFQDRVIGAFREKRIGWIRIAWSCRVHRFYLSNARQTRNGRLLRMTDDMLGKSRMRWRKSAIQGIMTSQKKAGRIFSVPLTFEQTISPIKVRR
jgi:hypothetical protein